MDVTRTLKKSLGQHLLKDKNLLRKMVRLAGVALSDTVVEIGPGHGDLTKVVAEVAGTVYAVELDRRFRDILGEIEKEYPNISVVYSSILDVAIEGFAGSDKVIVMGNIPYNVTGDILFKLLAEREVIKGAYLTMQKEVAERLVSRSHMRSYGALSVIFQFFADVKLLFLLKPGLFIPPPKVDSAFVSIAFRPDVTEDPTFIEFVKHCFRYKRKILRHSLQDVYDTGEIEGLYRVMNFPPSIRAEEIEPVQFLTMYRHLYRFAK
jgi:16S rRNA (adenine1518-N6/adenine1519-N6)-dimethyltransferase